jgi:hypothetical protein
VVYFFHSTRHGKRRGIERSDTQESMSAQTTCRVPRPRCTKCTKASLGFLAVRLSPQEPKICYGLIGTSIQGLKRERAQERKKTRVSPPFDPLAIATAGTGGMESKEQQKQQARGSTHLLLDRQGLRTREEKERMGSALL